MRKRRFLSALPFLWSVASFAASAAGAQDWRPLWNGKDFTGWQTYLGATDWPSTANPIGIDRDPLHVFTVVHVDGRPAIRISGEVIGELRTAGALGNYHLRLQFKWGNKKWPPRDNPESPRDSGLLYHLHSGLGAEGRVFGRSIELQIQEHDVGDLFPVGSAIAVRSTPRVSEEQTVFDYDPNGEWRYFSQIPGAQARVVKQPDNEKPSGEWNTIELICLGEESIHIVNGQVVMRLHDARRIDQDIPLPVTSGPIGLQSEFAEIFYRAIEMRSITEIPAEYTQTGEAQKRAGWQLLFDGHSTRGWHSYRQNSLNPQWRVENGMLTTTGKGGGDIVTDTAFGDFELQLEWKIERGGNSGIFYRVEESVPNIWQLAPEMQILDDEHHEDRLNPKHRAGAVYDLYAPGANAALTVGQFNTTRILAKGTHVEHWLNGHKVAAYDTASEDWKTRFAASKFAGNPGFAAPRTGRIGLQDHGDRVWFRNIRIRPL